jgi:hypothetical protein
MATAGLVEVPTVARVHDAFLGGKDAYTVDRTVARQLDYVSSGLADSARASRDFMTHMVATLAVAGVDQFIDLGCGYPATRSGENVHEIAQRHSPDARVIYADHDTAVLVHARAHLGGSPGVGVVYVDAPNVPEMLTHPTVARLIDPTRPIAVLLVHLLEFLDDPSAHRLLDVLAAALPRQSLLVLTHTTSDRVPAAAGNELSEAAALYSGFVAPYRLRSASALARLLQGYRLLPPGLCRAEEVFGGATNKARIAAAPVVATVARVDEVGAGSYLPDGGRR